MKSKGYSSYYVVWLFTQTGKLRLIILRVTIAKPELDFPCAGNKDNAATKSRRPFWTHQQNSVNLRTFIL